ncbi:MAG: OmpH family outer membrane protein, partial [Bacteroidales bacterium]|nr:OmpH family outer membrane protein [Bacteroidales bacterium]
MYKHFIIAVFCFLPLLAVAQEFGYINRAEVFQAMPETAEAMKKLDDLAKNYEGELLIMQEEYQKKGSEFVAQRDSLPESIRVRRMTEIQ